MKKIKRIAAMICVLVICFTVATPPAHADGLLGGQQFGAMIAAGLVSLNIVANTALQSQPVQALWNWCSAPSAQDRIDYLFPNTADIISNYMNASTIKVDQGVTTIDGVQYDELWISPGTFTNGLKTNLFDFKTKWNILSGQADIVLAEGVGTMLGNPVFLINGSYRTPTYSYTVGGGDYSAGQILWRSDSSRDQFFKNEYISRYNFYNIYNSSSAGQCYFQNINGNLYVYVKQNTGSWQRGGGGLTSEYIEEPFEYGYSSGIVPASENEIPENYGLSIKIPHDQLQTFYNTYPQYDVDNTVINIQEDEIDIDELTQAIFDMITTMEDVKVSWTSGEEPEPPVPVDPIDNIDENVQSINEYQQNMNQQVNHMHQDIETMQQTQQQQQQIQQDIKETSESIDSTLKDVKDAIKPGEITPKKFDLRRLFPFCIPFDIYNMLQKFDAQPAAPHVQLPFVIESIGFSYTLDLDFSAFDGLAAAMRTVELIVYCLGLAWATSKVIKW